MDKKQKIGKLGEKVVRKYLLENNYTIIEKNYKCKYGEIDIIAYDNSNKELVFIEIKTRSTEKFGKGIESIDIRKQKHIYKSAEYYLYIKKQQQSNMRIDAIEVFVTQNSVKIKHYYNVMFESPYCKRK